MKLATIASMAVNSSPAPPNRFRSLLDALFGEAWRLQRRRRRRSALLVLIACAAAIGVVFMVRGGGSSSRSGSVAAVRVAVASQTLPGMGSFPRLAVAGGRLIVSDTENKASHAGRITGTCAAATIDPSSLRVVSVARGDCGDPALYGERVLPLVFEVNPRPGHGWGTDELGIRIATVDHAVSGGYRVGPIVVVYPDCSTCRAQWIYGPDSLWVFASMTSPGAPGELLRISATTGRLERRWALPAPMTRALLATDEDGLWFAPGIETCCGGPKSAWAGEQYLYHVGPGATRPVRVLDLGQLGASWLVAYGHTVWVQGRSVNDRVPSPHVSFGPAPLWRVNGPAAKSKLIGARVPEPCGDLGEGPAIVLGTPTIGIYCVAPESSSQHVVRFDPRGRSAITVASEPSTAQYSVPDSAVVFDGSYYFLDPPGATSASTPNAASSARSPGRSAVLYRITPR